MSYQVYKIVHILGLAGVFTALGGLTLHALNGGTREDNPSRKLLVATHGSSLILMLVGGMGMLARIGITSGLPGWAWLKLILWGLVGGLVSVILRKPAQAKPIWFVLPVLAGAGAWIAIYKPLTTVPAQAEPVAAEHVAEPVEPVPAEDVADPVEPIPAQPE